MPPRTIESNQGKGSRPWPSCFLVRTTGEVVPLIAVDELPLGLNLVNVPRAIQLEATKGMLNLGLQKSSGGYYNISSHPGQVLATKSTDCHFNTRHTNGGVPWTRNANASPLQATTPTNTIRTATSSSSTSPSDTETEGPPFKPLLDSHGSAKTRQSQNALFPRPYTNSQIATNLCRHWCTHGICKWGQQCRYKHIMPMTHHGLQEIGLTDWPNWYRRLNPGYFIDSNGGGTDLHGRRGGLSLRGRAGRKWEEGKNGGGLDKRMEGEGGLGGQILRKLRGIDRERKSEKDRERELLVKRKAEHDKEEKRRAMLSAQSHEAAVETDAKINVMRWEDDESEDEEVQERKNNIVEGSGERGKILIDI